MFRFFFFVVSSVLLVEEYELSLNIINPYAMYTYVGKRETQKNDAIEMLQKIWFEPHTHTHAHIRKTNPKK